MRLSKQRMVETLRASLPMGPLALAVGIMAAVPGSVAGQELADYDYENLGLRGISLEGGYIVPNNVESTYSMGVQMDLGYLGPGLRIVTSASYWSSDLKESEVTELEERVADLVLREAEPGTPRPDVNLGPIAWSDLVLTVDGHFRWAIPLEFVGYAGAGGSAHLMNGSGDAIDGTFVEDLLDSIRAGFNLHAGLERRVHDQIRLHTQARYEILGDLRYLEFRAGVQYFFGESAPGEEGR